MSTDDIPPPPSSHSHPTDSLASALNESGVAPTEAAAAAAANSTSRQYYNRLDNPSTNLQGNLSLESSITFTASKKREEQNLHNQQNTAVMTSGDNQVPEGKVVESSEATRVTDTNLVDSTPKPGTVINTSTSKNPASSLLMSVLQDPQEEAMLNAHRESKVENAIEGENANSAMIYDAVQTTRGQEENQQYHHPQQRAQGPLETSCSTSAGKALPHSVSLKRPRHLITDVAHYPGHASRQVSNNNDQQAQEDASKRQKLVDASTEMHAPVLPPLASAPEFETPRESNSPANDAGASKKLNNEQWEAMYEQLKL